jgi:hypothetical protein
VRIQFSPKSDGPSAGGGRKIKLGKESVKSIMKISPPDGLLSEKEFAHFVIDKVGWDRKREGTLGEVLFYNGTGRTVTFWTKWWNDTGFWAGKRID